MQKTATISKEGGISRYLSGQKISDYLIEKVLAAFAEGLSAQEAAHARRKGGPSRNTVYALYDLVRRRLLEIGYFTPPEEFLEQQRRDPELWTQFQFSAVARRIEAQAVQMNGASEESARYILADIIFRATHPDLSIEAFLRDIKQAVKITGPLNRPATNIDLWHAKSYVIELDRQIGELRRQYHPVAGANARTIAALMHVRRQAMRKFNIQLRMSSANKNVRFR